MKAFQIKIRSQKDEETVVNLLKDLEQKGTIELSESPADVKTKPTPVSEDQAQEIIEESEIGPYYSEKDAKDILNI